MGLQHWFSHRGRRGLAGAGISVLASAILWAGLLVSWLQPGVARAQSSEESQMIIDSQSSNEARMACLRLRASEIQMVLELEPKNIDARAIIAAYQEHQRKGYGMFRDLGRLDQLNLEINELKLKISDLRREIAALKSSGNCPD